MKKKLIRSDHFTYLEIPFLIKSPKTKTYSKFRSQNFNELNNQSYLQIPSNILSSLRHFNFK